jgi:hypothetical protein
MGGLQEDVRDRDVELARHVGGDVGEPVGPVLVGDRIPLGVDRPHHHLIAVAVAHGDDPGVDGTEHCLGGVDWANAIATQEDAGQRGRGDVLLVRADGKARGELGDNAGRGPVSRAMVLVGAAVMGAPMLAGGMAVNRRAEARPDAGPEADGDSEHTDDQPDDQGALDEPENLKTLPDKRRMRRFLVKRSGQLRRRHRPG